MKKLLIFIFIFLFPFCSISYANDIDGYYRQEILNNNLPFNTTGFFEAIRRGNITVVDLFLKAGMNPNATLAGSPAPMQALYLNQVEILDLLLSSGADVETEVPALFVATKKQNLLSYAIKKKNENAVKVLIKYGVDVNKIFDNQLPLTRAKKSRQENIVKLLIQAGAQDRI